MRSIKEIIKEQAKVQKTLKGWLEEERRAQKRIAECYKRYNKLRIEEETREKEATNKLLEKYQMLNWK